MSKKKINNYQAALTELQEIVSNIESNTVSIDDLSEQMKRAAALIDFCQKKLRTTEANIAALFEEK